MVLGRFGTYWGLRNTCNEWRASSKLLGFGGQLAGVGTKPEENRLCVGVRKFTPSGDLPGRNRTYDLSGSGGQPGLPLGASRLPAAAWLRQAAPVGSAAFRVAA
jgi:hypothetical protein